jgi:hypothetical protein
MDRRPVELKALDDDLLVLDPEEHNDVVLADEIYFRNHVHNTLNSPAGTAPYCNTLHQVSLHHVPQNAISTTIRVKLSSQLMSIFEGDMDCSATYTAERRPIWSVQSSTYSCLFPWGWTM